MGVIFTGNVDWAKLQQVLKTLGNVSRTVAGLAAGTTNGKIKTTNAIQYSINGVNKTKAGTDNLWDLSAESAPGALTYGAYWLYLDGSGNASFSAQVKGSSVANAVAALPYPDSTKAVVGVYVTAVNETMSGALGGTFYEGFPTATL